MRGAVEASAIHTHLASCQTVACFIVCCKLDGHIVFHHQVDFCTCHNPGELVDLQSTQRLLHDNRVPIVDLQVFDRVVLCLEGAGNGDKAAITRNLSVLWRRTCCATGNAHDSRNRQPGFICGRNNQINHRKHNHYDCAGALRIIVDFIPVFATQYD